MLYKSIFSVRAEPKACGQWCSDRSLNLLHDIKGNHPRALPRAVPEQRRGKILLYGSVLSNGGVPGLEICRVGWGSDAGCN